MSRLCRRTTLGLFTVGVAVGLAAGATASAAAEKPRQPVVPATPPTAAFGIPQTVIAVAGSNGALYVKRSSEASFRGLGGALSDAPAVAYSSFTRRTYYVVKGINNALYVRTDTTAFTPIVPSSCKFSPAVGIFGSRFVVACIGPNGALYAGSATLMTASNPRVSTLLYQGGVAAQGPAIFFAGNTPHFSIVDTEEPAFNFNVLSRSADEPAGVYHDNALSCNAAPDTVGDPASFTNHFFGCRNGYPLVFGGTSESLYLAWNGGEETAGSILGRVGIAAAGDGSAALCYVIGSNGRVYSKRVITGARTADPFVLVGGQARPGVAATTIG